MKIRLVPLAALATSLAVSSLAFAQQTAATPPGVRMAPEALAQGVGTDAATTKGKVLVRTWLASGNASATLGQFAFNLIDTTTVGCYVDAGCTIGIENMTQIIPSGGNWAICLYVNGLATSCQYQGLYSGLTSYVVGHARGVAATVARGTHVVETKIYTEGATPALGYWQTDIRVYKP